MESILTIEIRIKHDPEDADVIERHVDNLLDEGSLQDLILDPCFLDGDNESLSASCTFKKAEA